MAVLVVALVHFVPDAVRPGEVLGRYRDAMSAGSYLALSHASRDGEPERAPEHQELYRRTATPMTMRSREEILGLLAGFELVEPGLVYLPLWRPTDPAETPPHPERFTGFAGVGRLVDQSGAHHS